MGELMAELQPQDLLKYGIIPELVGRMPVVTTLESLDRDQMVRILTEPKNALVKQYQVLLNYDEVELSFTPRRWRRWPTGRWPGRSEPGACGPSWRRS